MSISNISSLFSAQAVQPTTSGAQPAAEGADTAAATSGVTVDISKPGQLFSQLSSLAESDPDRFKAVAAEIAKQLQAVAAQGDAGHAAFLGKLADRFTAASQSGNISDLKPDSAQGAGHHHGGHGGRHRIHNSGAAETGSGAPGVGPNEGVASTVQDIIVRALGADTSVTSG